MRLATPSEHRVLLLRAAALGLGPRQGLHGSMPTRSTWGQRPRRPRLSGGLRPIEPGYCYVRWCSVSDRCRDCAVLARPIARSHRKAISVRRLLGPLYKETYGVTVRRLLRHGA